MVRLSAVLLLLYSTSVLTDEVMQEGFNPQKNGDVSNEIIIQDNVLVQRKDPRDIKDVLYYLPSKPIYTGGLLTPCKVDDTECLSKTTQQFLEKTCQGIPEYNIKPIDPLFIPDLDIVIGDDLETVLHYKNLTITGLKNQQFSDMKMDTKAKSVVLQTRADLNIIGDVTVELGKIHKLITGSYTLKGTALGTASYGYDFKTDDKGIEHYEVGPETISCQTVNEPEVVLGPELRQAIEQDENLKEKKESFKRKELQKLVFCKMVEKAYVTVVHNIRAAAKILPKSAFLDGV